MNVLCVAIVILELFHLLVTAIFSGRKKKTNTKRVCYVNNTQMVLHLRFCISFG